MYPKPCSIKLISFSNIDRELNVPICQKERPERWKRLEIWLGQNEFTYKTRRGGSCDRFTVPAIQVETQYWRHSLR